MGSIIELLDTERVLRITPFKRRNTLRFIDGCDKFFEVQLDKKQMQKLISELQELESKMI